MDGEGDEPARKDVLPFMLLSNMLFDDQRDAFSFAEEHEDVGEWDGEGSCDLGNSGEDICGGVEGGIEGGQEGRKVSLANGHDECVVTRLVQVSWGGKTRRDSEVLTILISRILIACHKA